MDAFDLLVEQQDQELALNGELSPATMLMLQQYKATGILPCSSATVPPPTVHGEWWLEWLGYEE